jgi:hypothetical protein
LEVQIQDILRLLGVSSRDLIIACAIVIAASILILLLLRGFWCWFFKTTEISYFLEEISDKITALHKSQLELNRLIVNQQFEQKITENKDNENEEG